MGFEFLVDRATSIPRVSLGGCNILGKHDSENSVSRKDYVIASKVGASITAYNAFTYIPSGTIESRHESRIAEAIRLGLVCASLIEDTCVLTILVLIDNKRTIREPCKAP